MLGLNHFRLLSTRHPPWKVSPRQQLLPLCFLPSTATTTSTLLDSTWPHCYVCIGHSSRLFNADLCIWSDLMACVMYYQAKLLQQSGAWPFFVFISLPRILHHSTSTVCVHSCFRLIATKANNESINAPVDWHSDCTAHLASTLSLIFSPGKWTLNWPELYFFIYLYRACVCVYGSESAKVASNIGGGQEEG